MKKYAESIAIFLFWIAVWQMAAVLVSNRIFLAGPHEVALALIKLLRSAEFYPIILKSFLRIAGGFFLGWFMAMLLSFVGFLVPFFHRLISPVLRIIRTVPVASFVILFLIWSGSEYLSTWISFFVTLPLLYQNIYTGLGQTDHELLEVAEVFSLPLGERIRHLYLQTILPYMAAGYKTAVGMSFKAGVAAEVIAVASGTIGEGLYLSKIYLCTDELFAWTIVIVILCTLLEKFVGLLFRDTN